MRFLYSNAHPSDTLESQRAGHLVRAQQLIDALRRSGHEVVVEEAAAGAVAQSAAKSYWRARSAMPAGAARGARDLARLVQNRRFATRLSATAARVDADVILETQVSFSTAGARAAIARRIPLVLDDVSPLEEDDRLHGVGLPGMARRTRRFSLAHAHLVVVVSEVMRAHVMSEGVGGERVLIVPNGVNPAPPEDPADVGDRRARLGLDATAVVAAFAGSFQPFHRVDLLVDAMTYPESAGIHLLLVGDGDERARVEGLAHRAGVAGRIVFTGRLPSDDVVPTLRAADMCVLPAADAYLNPMKVYDYLAAGRPLVVPDEQAISVMTGDLPVTRFAAGSGAALAAAMAGLAADPVARAQMGSAALQLAGHHRWDDRAAALVHALQS